MSFSPTRNGTPPRSPIAAALAACRGGFLAVALFSGVLTVLVLTGSLFMLQIYDRVLPSRSVPTLVALVVLVAALYSFQGVLDAIRGRMLVRVGAALDKEAGGHTYEAVVQLPLRTRSDSDGLQPVRDLDQLRSFLSSTGPTALFDLPWIPLYLGLCFIFHVWIGVTALVGASLLVALTLLTEALTRAPARTAVGFGASRLALAGASRRNAEVLQAMGMAGRLAARWTEVNGRYVGAHQQASDVAVGLGAATRALRMMLQSAVLAVGAYLVIHQEATAGIIIASSILMTRALAPVELAVANWKSFIAARESRRRLSDLLTAFGHQEAAMPLPPPNESFSVETISVVPPGLHKPVVADVTFQLRSGQGLGIIGPSASGKSSLARALVGIWRPARGKIRLDGAALEQWVPEELGRHIGYLPQDVELFDGTVAENIARFEPEPDSQAIIAAARAAGVHELILRLPDGYGSKIGESGMALSAGQRQRIALARALYGDPFLVVLDEPNANLDAEGEEALTQAILAVRQHGGIVIVVAHRRGALVGVDQVLAMANGQACAFGPKQEVLRKVLQPARPNLRPIVAAGAERTAS
ncbi:MAG: type I secretion system permease/ATPase [Rhodospirillales bacterium]|nr:type I secretion system permease/ATPase [Rhodospirillales bacterium]